VIIENEFRDDSYIHIAIKTEKNACQTPKN
jgi:hypothetical protein